jgi:formamidopyrimidine-DNA glycosylase
VTTSDGAKSSAVPELPEVETIARDLEGLVRGAKIKTVRVLRPDVLREVTPRAFEKRLIAVVLERFWRRGKYVIADLSSGDRLVVSPKFTGAFLVERKRPLRVPGHLSPVTGNERTASDYTCIEFHLDDGRLLRWRDVRRLGTVALMSPTRFARWEATMGPEPFDETLTAEIFSKSVRSSKRAIKTIIMDQHRIAGVGNIYANEALWRSKIRPTRRGSALTRAQASVLLQEIREVLRLAVEQRGTSFRDYQDPSGGRGGFLGLAKVYDRAGEPCVRCGSVLSSTHAIEGRVTVWCRRCQR